MDSRRSERRDAVITHVGLSEARARLGAVIRRVHVDKEYVVLQRGGEPVAALVDIDDFEDLLELRDPEVQRILADALAILKQDPFNRTRTHHIRKLANVRTGEGQFGSALAGGGFATTFRMPTSHSDTAGCAEKTRIAEKRARFYR